VGKEVGLEWADGKLVLGHLRGSATISYGDGGGNVRTPRTFTHSLLCAHLRTILHRMQGKVNLRHGLLLMYRTDGVVKLVGAVRTMTSRFSIHVQKWRQRARHVYDRV